MCICICTPSSPAARRPFNFKVAAAILAVALRALWCSAACRALLGAQLDRAAIQPSSFCYLLPAIRPPAVPLDAPPNLISACMSQPVSASDGLVGPFRTLHSPRSGLAPSSSGCVEKTHGHHIKMPSGLGPCQHSNTYHHPYSLLRRSEG